MFGEARIERALSNLQKVKIDLTIAKEACEKEQDSCISVITMQNSKIAKLGGHIRKAEKIITALPNVEE